MRFVCMCSVSFSSCSSLPRCYGCSEFEPMSYKEANSSAFYSLIFLLLLPLLTLLFLLYFYFCFRLVLKKNYLIKKTNHFHRVHLPQSTFLLMSQIDEDTHYCLSKSY